MPVTADDLMTDFDAAIARMVEEAKAEYDAIPPEEREAFHLRNGAVHLIKMLDAGAPSFVVAMAEDSLASKLRRRKRARRATSAQA